MVMLIAVEPTPVYEVLDLSGSVIGRVVRPSAPHLVGIGEGTVLLQRPCPALEIRRPRTAA
ncbi:MAG: hypothetical protein ACHQXA_00200 [Gemmatimonadales bacterium]|jgi:hypothetical protein